MNSLYCHPFQVHKGAAREKNSRNLVGLQKKNNQHLRQTYSHPDRVGVGKLEYLDRPSLHQNCSLTCQLNEIREVVCKAKENSALKEVALHKKCTRTVPAMSEEHFVGLLEKRKDPRSMENSVDPVGGTFHPDTPDHFPDVGQSKGLLHYCFTETHILTHQLRRVACWGFQAVWNT